MVLQAEKVLLQEAQSEREPEQITVAPAPKTIYIQAPLAGLDYPLIPFAVLQHDPLAAVKHYLEQLYPTTEMQAISEEQLYDAWNSLFSALKPTQHFFLYAWSSAPGISSAILRAMGLVFVIARPGPYSTRWLTTSPVWHQGSLVAWCVPVDMGPVEDQDHVELILLTKENMLRFSSPNTLLQMLPGEGRKSADFLKS